MSKQGIIAICHLPSVIRWQIENNVERFEFRGNVRNYIQMYMHSVLNILNVIFEDCFIDIVLHVDDI